MSSNIVISTDAELDLEAAKRWYGEAETGLGLEFVRAVDAALAKVARYPYAYQAVHRSARRVILRRFPYFLLYTVLGDTVFVLGCFHVHRDPVDWKARV